MLKKIVGILSDLFCIVLLTVYNAREVNTKQLKIREETIPSEKIKDDQNGFLIAYFSDVCYGSYIDEEILQKAGSIIDSYAPDLIIFGGDLLDQSEMDVAPETVNMLKEFLSGLDAPFGKFAVMGDRDCNNEDILQEIYDASEFMLLRNESRMIGSDKDDLIVIAGIDPFVQEKPPYTQLLADDQHFSIVVTHYPDLFLELERCRFDLCLAGHSLGGQIYLPIINLFQREYGCQKYYHGRSKKDGHILDITNGIGRRKTDARLWADAEIVFYNLKSVHSGE